MFKEKDGYRIGFLPYHAIPKVNDNNTLLNFNVQKDGNDVPYKFYEFADSSYSYTFQNQSQYSLSLLTKIAGDPKYENNPLIVSFDIEISNYNQVILVTILFLVIFSLIIIIFVPNFRKQISRFLVRIFIKK